MKTISRYIMTLALLLTAVTGAWAQTVYNSTVAVTDLKAGDILIEGAQVTFPSDFSYYLYFLNNRFFLNNETTPNTSGFTHNTTTVTVGANGLVTGLSYGATTRPATESGEEGNAWEVTAVEDKNVKIVGITYAPSSGPEVDWNASTKTGTFTMPGSDVVLTPIYAKAAAFATTGTGSEVKTLLPEAAEGVIAGTDAPLIKEGTGIVAFAGESTEATQGTLMYAIGNSDTEAPELTAFSATVPTAENVADDGADVLVWYYIQGADAPQDEAATLDNTFSDTEPACLTVQVLTNKFDIQLNAANANTIEAGKATVTVAGAAATVTDGKLEGVKMGSEVKMTAKEGYKFRKVEVKKGAEAPAISFSKQKWDVESAPANFISVSQADAKAAADAEKTQANAPGYVCIYALEGGQYKWIDSHGRTGQHSSIGRIANVDAFDEIYECYNAGDNNSIWFTVEPTN